MKPKITLNVKQIENAKWWSSKECKEDRWLYRVTKVVNSIDCHIGQDLTGSETKAYIAMGWMVSITSA